MIGIFAFGEVSPAIEPFFSGDFSGAMGVITLDGILGIRPGIIGFFIILMALGMFYGAEWIEKTGIKKYKNKG